MENAVSVQTFEFLYSALLGIGIGVFFDFLRTVRAYMSDKRWITGLFDALFWIVALIALFAFVLTSSGGRMRWYVLVGVFCGGFVYRAAASEIVFKVMKGTSDSLIKILSMSTRPLYMLFKWIRDCGRRINKKVIAGKSRRKQKKKGKVDRIGSKKEKKKERSS